MKKTPRTLSAALAAAFVLTLAALPAPAPAATAETAAVELKIEGRGLDVVAEELTLRAECDRDCTLGLATLNVLRYDRAGQQLPGAASTTLKGSKRLRAGKATLLPVPLGSWARTHLQSAIVDGGYAVVQVAVKVDGQEGPYTSASLHGPGVPKRTLAPVDYTVNLKPKLPSQPARYLVSITGTQTTTWSYDRDRANGACTIVSNGSGKQTLRFRSTKAVPSRVSYGKRIALIVAPDGSAPLQVPMRIDAERDGTVNAGASGACGEVPAGGEDDGPAPAPGCRRTGSIAKPAMLYFGRRDVLNIGLEPEGELAPLTTGPNCPIEPFTEADQSLDLLDAVHRLADPGGRDGKVILIAKATKTDKLEGGSTTTKVSWTVTFRKLG